MKAQKVESFNLQHRDHVLLHSLALAMLKFLSIEINRITDMEEEEECMCGNDLDCKEEEYEDFKKLLVENLEIILKALK